MTGGLGEEVRVVDNPAAGRFETSVDGRLAELVYRRDGRRLVLVHTGVPDELEGRGLGSRLVRSAIEHAREEGLTVVPACPFARRWLEGHPDVASTVTIEWPGRT